MATLDDLISLVYVHTKRTDLIAETSAAVKKATLKLHGLDFWKQDRKEVIITPTPIATGLSRYQLDVSDATSFPLFRKASVITEYRIPLTGQERVFEEEDANNIRDSYGYEKQNYFYQVGLALNLVAAAAVTQIKVAYYQYPNITTGGYSSWIANQFPDAIAEEAARMIFKMIGKDEEFQKYEALTIENLAIIRMTGI